MRLSVSHMLRIFCLITTMFLVAVLLLVYAAFSQNLRDTTRVHLMQSFSVIKGHVDKQIQEIKTDILNIADQEEINLFFRDTPVDRFDKVERIRSMLSNVTRFRTAVKDVYLYCSDGATLMTGESTDICSHVTYRRLLAGRNLQSVFRNVHVTEAIQVLHSTDSFFGITAPVFSSRYNRTADHYLGAAVAICSLQSMFQNTQTGELPLWIARGDTVLVTSDSALSSAWVKRQEEPLRFEDQTVTVLSLNIAGTPWHLFTAYTDNDLLDGIEPIRSWGLILILGIVLSQALLTLVIERSITRPIIDIAHQTQHIATLDSQIENPVVARNELKQLTKGINSMLERFDQMNLEIARSQQLAYEAKLGLLQERIMFLQTQINPHFLYNSLECIRGMAAEGDEEAVRETASLMASLYRYCIKHGHTVTVSDELAYVTQYFDIIKMRYRKRYTLTIDCPKEAEALLMPRMVLQPIVENAVLHGFVHACRQCGHVHIRVDCRDGLLSIRVDDDGAGMPPESLDAFNRSLLNITQEKEWAESKIGVHNAASRIALLFGSESGVHFSVNENGGITVRLSIRQSAA